MKYIKRTIQNHVLEHLSYANNEILLLSGARQTGKSTIVENLPCKEEKTIINLWDKEREINALRITQFTAPNLQLNLLNAITFVSYHIYQSSCAPNIF